MTVTSSIRLAGRPDTSECSTEQPVRFRLRTFGTLDLRDAHDAEAPPLLQRGKPLGLLVYCASERRRAHSRDSLSALLWADAAPERSRHNLRQAVWRLRRVLGEALETRDDAIVGVHHEVLVDRDQFLEAVARNDLAAALAVYTGPFLPDVSFPGGDDFEEWVRGERVRLEETLVRLVETVVRADAPRLRPAERREAVQALIDRAPDSLEARRTALDLALELGDRVTARRCADDMEALALRLDLALSSAARASIDRARTPDDAMADDTGPFPALALVGRDEPYGAAMSAWAQVKRGESRFVLLRGTAGVGKSRLLDAIADRCEGRRTQSLIVRANLGEAAVPYSFAALLARELSGLRGAAGISTESARELVALDPGLASRFAGAHPPSESGEAARRRALALVDLVHAVAEQQPLALFLDDLHWVDAASRETLTMVLARIRELPVLVVGTVRDAFDGEIMPAPVQAFDLAPLPSSVLRESLESSGQWPDDPAAVTFLDGICASSQGLPLDVVDRLTLVVDAGLLSYREGRWASPDWPRAAQLVTASAPSELRLQGCTDDERSLLRILAVAGIPLSDDVMTALPLANATIHALEGKGFVRLDHDGWRPSHDTVAERVRTESAPEMLLEAHRQLGRGLQATARAERLPMALRHLVAAGDEQAAGDCFAAMLSRARARGDRRAADVLLTEVIGDHLAPTQKRALLSGIPWYHRQPETLARGGVFVLALITLVAVTAAWYQWRRPALRFMQTAVVTQPAPLFGSNALRLVPSAILRVGDPGARTTTPRVVRVRPLGSGTRLLSSDSVLADSGLVSFGGLRFTSTDSIVRFRFESRGYRSVDLEVRAEPYRPLNPVVAALRLLSGQFTVGGVRQTIAPDAPRLRVARGALIDGVVQLHYSSGYTAASVWASMTPTWGEPAREGRELFPVPTPVTSDVVDAPVTVQAPSVPGHYWILLTIAAEPSGGFALSGTNWTMEQPIWGDGNDLAQLPDSVLRKANRTGFVETMIAYPASHRRNRPQCREASPSVLYCPAEHAVVSIAVEVR